MFQLIRPALVAGGLVMTPGLLLAQGQPQFAEELKILRRELFQDMEDRQMDKVQVLERELEQARRECSLIDAAFARDEQELAEWANELQTSELSPEQRAQAEMARREGNVERAETLRSKRAAAVAREAELVEKLTREKNRLQRARQVLEALGR